jgi:hypothetical protein
MINQLLKAELVAVKKGEEYPRVFVLRLALACSVHDPGSNLPLEALRSMIARDQIDDDETIIETLFEMGRKAHGFEDDVIRLATRNDDAHVRKTGIRTLARFEANSDKTRELLLNACKSAETATERAAAALAIVDLFPEIEIDFVETILSCNDGAFDFMVYRDELFDALIVLALRDKSDDETVTGLLKQYELKPERREFLLGLLNRGANQRAFWRRVQNGPDELRQQIQVDFAKYQSKQ